MAVEIKRVSYTYNSALEDQGKDSYFFDCLICRDGEVVVDRHESFKSRDDFFEALESVVPLVPIAEDDSDEWEHYANRQYDEVEDL